MKKKILFTFLLSILSVGQMSATYYSRLVTEVSSTSPTGAGMVYASASDTSEPDTLTYKTSSSANQSSKQEKASLTFYAFAKANDGFHFVGWSETNGGSVVSEANPYNISIPCVTSDQNNPTTVTLYANFIAKTSVTIKFLSPSTSQGSYTATDGTTSISNTGTITTDEAITLSAKASSGYKVLAWYTTDDGGTTKNYFSTDATVSRIFSESTSVGVDFVKEDLPVFVVKGSATPYTDLNAANKASGGDGIIVLASSGTLTSGQYTISSGNTLLIPFDDTYTCYTTGPGFNNTRVSPSAYKTLTLASGASIAVNGAISVSAQMFAANGGTQGAGAVNGNYGYIVLNSGSAITLNSGSNLYAWGYISGAGEIKALSGSNVYEGFQINDFRGGSITQKMEYAVFPFNQYYFQNIESKLTLNNGAVEYAHSCVYANSQYQDTGNFALIGSATAGTGMFRLANGSLTKYYNSATDRQEYSIDGSAEINSLTISIAGNTINSVYWVLPITNNMTITQNTGTFTVNQHTAILPGAEIIIREEAELELGAGIDMFVYDESEWGNYAWKAKLNPVVYTPSNGTTIKRTEDDLVDAKIDVQGNMTVNGNLYTTTNGANICCSTGSGVLTMNVIPKATNTYQYTGSSHDDLTLHYIPVTSAQLKNGISSPEYTATSEASAGTTFYYNKNTNIWSTTEPSDIEFAFNEGHNMLTLVSGTAVSADDIKAAVEAEINKGNTIGSVDMSADSDPISIAATRSAIGASDDNNILLITSEANTSNVSNVITKSSSGVYTAKSFVLIDKEPIDIPVDFTATSVSYSRTNTTYSDEMQWGTICLPFAVKSDDNIQYYTIKNIKDDVLTLEEATSVPANTPAIYSVASSVSEISITASNSKIYTTEYAISDAVETDDKGSIVLVGVQRMTATIPVSADAPYYYIAENKFWQPSTNSVTVYPQRAYFKTSGATALAKVLSIEVYSDEAVSINGVLGDDDSTTVIGYYNVNGVQQNGPQRGLNIIKFSNGKTIKVIIK